MARRTLHLTPPLPSPEEARRLRLIDERYWRRKTMVNPVIGMLWDEFAVGCIFGVLVGAVVMFGIMV